MFVFGIVYGIYYSLPSLIIQWLIRTHSVADWTMLIWFWGVALTLIRWGLLFIVLIVMYYAGKKLDLKVNLRSIIISAFVAGFIGYFLVRLVSMPLFFMIVEREIGVDFAVAYLVGDLHASLEMASNLFFAAFTALAIAHIRKTEQH